MFFVHIEKFDKIPWVSPIELGFADFIEESFVQSAGGTVGFDVYREAPVFPVCAPCARKGKRVPLAFYRPVFRETDYVFFFVFGDLCQFVSGKGGSGFVIVFPVIGIVRADPMPCLSAGENLEDIIFLIASA